MGTLHATSKCVVSGLRKMSCIGRPVQFGSSTRLIMSIKLFATGVGSSFVSYFRV